MSVGWSTMAKPVSPRMPRISRWRRLEHHSAVADVMSDDGDDGADGKRPVLYQPGMTMAEVERATIEAALQEYRGNRRRAAEVLGIGERTLYRKIKEYKLPEALLSPDGA